MSNNIGERERGERKERERERWECINEGMLVES